MKEFSNKLSVVPSDQVLSVVGSEVALRSGAQFDTLMTDSLVSVDVDSGSSDGGPYTNFTARAVSGKISRALRQRYFPGARVVALLFDGTAGVYVFGTPEFPARITITPDLNRDSVEISLKAPSYLSPL
jgi:hypothetical protein